MGESRAGERKRGTQMLNAQWERDSDQEVGRCAARRWRLVYA